MLRNRLRQPLAKWVLVVLSLVPFAYLCAGVYFDSLGPNPAEYLIRSTGDWTLRGLCLGLARAGPVSPPAGFADLPLCLPAPELLCLV